VVMVAIGIATAQAFYREHQEVLRAQRVAARKELAEQIAAAVRAERERAGELEDLGRARLPDAPVAWPGKVPLQNRR
jgi:hypothetical protein